MKIKGIILAAGFSSRMGAFKPLLELRGKTIIEYSIDSMFAAGVEQVVIVLGYRGNEIEALVKSQYDMFRVKVVHNKKFAQTDMLTSVKLGVLSLEPCDAFYLLPGDMPAINTQTFEAVKQVFCTADALVAFPTIEGYRKHPPLIAWGCRRHILNFDKEGGLREVWKQLEGAIVTVAVDDLGCTIDADTIRDYKRLIKYMES